MQAKRLVELRNKRGLTQGELAYKLELTRSRLSQYEIGTRNPDFDTLIRIANFFNVSTDYLLGRTNIPTSELTMSERNIVDNLDMTDEELDRLQMIVKDRPLTLDEKKRVIRTIRALLDEG